MKKTVIAVSLLGLLSGAAMAAEIPNKDVADAMQSLVSAEKAAYDKMIAARSKVHGCALGTDLKNNPALIPTTEYFQMIVGVAFKSYENGKYAIGLDPALATKAGTMPAEQAADILHAYADISRTTYTGSVIARAKVSKCSTPSEQWSEEKGLPLPAQFTRATAENVRKSGKFTYTLQSEWPINKQNAAKTAFEKRAIGTTMKGSILYGDETLAGKSYFVAAYPDVATNNACASCHNDHADSPKKDFKLKDVMGDMLIRLPLAK